MSKDATLATDIPTEIEAQIALQGWVEGDLTEQQKVYVSLLTLKGLVPRLLLLFSSKLKSAKGGPAETEWQEAIDFLKELRKEVKEQVETAQHEAFPEDLEKDVITPPPMAGWRAP